MTRAPSFEDPLGDFTADIRVVTLAAMAALVGVISAFVALALVRLIGFFTNLAYFHRFDTSFTAPSANALGLWAVGVPVAAGGMAAVFGTPVAAALLAVELLLFEWKPRSFIPVACAAAVAGALRVPLLGSGPPSEDLFRKLPIHWMWWPVLGGAVVGLGGLLYPRALGVGYDTIDDLLAGRLVGVALVGLMLTKAVIWAAALGSGTSGGVLAPLLIMGGSLGALAASWIPAGDPGLWAAISMGAMMGGTMRSPSTAVAFVLGLTQRVNVLAGPFAACVAAP